MEISVLDKHWFVLYCSPHIARSFWSDLSCVQRWPNFRWDRRFPVPSPSGLGVGMENKNIGRRDGNWGNLEYWERAFQCVKHLYNQSCLSTVLYRTCRHWWKPDLTVRAAQVSCRGRTVTSRHAHTSCGLFLQECKWLCTVSSSFVYMSAVGFVTLISCSPVRVKSCFSRKHPVQ